MKSNKGYSLVEVLVAAAIITLSLVAVVAFVRKGQEMITVQKHRAMARGIVQRTLESGQYQSENYKNLPAQPATPTTTNVVIDAETNPNIPGSLTVTVGDEHPKVNNRATPYRAVTVTVTWTEPGGSNETVSVEKWLTDVKRN
jgi:prepilin-type N-terminal cleavage/methylation domain-containing protein